MHIRRYATGSPVRAVELSCDNWNFNASNPCLCAGGNYNQNLNHGLFYVNYNSASNTNANHGSRHVTYLLILLFCGTGFRAPLGEDKQYGSRLVHSFRNGGKPVLLT